MRRREFLTSLAGLTTWPFGGHAEQTAIPAVGFLSSLSAAALTGPVAAFRDGLQSVGYTEGKNVEIEFRWADGHYDRLPALAADLVRRQVAVIVTIGGGPPAFAAKAASTTIPIVFMVGRDPVELGLVKSLNRPGGNATGINLLIVEMESKRIELIRQLAPTSNVFAVLVNPKSADADVQLKAVQSAAHALNEQIKIFNVSNEIELEMAFAKFREDDIRGFILVADPFFMNRRDQIISSAAQGRSPRAQQSAMPVIGFLNSGSPGPYARNVAALRQGLEEAGYIEGQNVALEYRWAEGQTDRLPVLAADLVHRQVAVIAATSTPAALAAKSPTTTIPIIFELGSDPVELGLVSSLSRPGGNVTGVTQLGTAVAPKRLELLHELLPTARVMALLVDATDPTNAKTIVSEVSAAAHTFGLQLHVLNASNESDLIGVFAKLIQLGAGGLVVGGGSFFVGREEQLAALTVRHAVPAASERREFAAAGGLLSYGTSLSDAYRLAGVYAARILKGEKPGDLPVQQATKVELFLNLKTAETLGITVTLPLSGRADELIE